MNYLVQFSICIYRNCTGYMLPKTFFDQKQNYICATCGLNVSHDDVDKVLEKIGIDLSSMKKNDINACKEFLNRYKNVLHTNHFYIIDITIALAQLIGQQSGGLQVVNENLLVEKIEFCKKLNDILKILAPGKLNITYFVYGSNNNYYYNIVSFYANSAKFRSKFS